MSKEVVSRYIEKLSEFYQGFGRGRLLARLIARDNGLAQMQLLSKRFLAEAFTSSKFG